MKLFTKKRRVFKAAALLLAALLTIPLFAGVQAFRFHRFTDTLFRRELESDTLSMHYILAWPEQYGISEDTAQLSVYSKEAQEQAYLQLARYEKTVGSIKPLFFRTESRLLYLLLAQHLRNQSQEQNWPYYAEPLSPASGIQSSLPILLAEYTFRSKQDVENYLALLAQIPAYLEGIAAYEKEKADAGLFMSDTAADKIIEQCYQIMDAGQLADGTHFLHTTFAERLQSLLDRQLLTPAEQESYLQQNQTLLLNSVMPAYEALGDAMLLLKGSGTNDGGLAGLPDGKAYYAFLFAQTTGCSRPLDEVEQLLVTRLQADTRALAELVQKSPALLAVSPEDEFPQADPTVYLKDLQSRMDGSFPAIPEDTDLSCTVKPVSASLEDYSSPAFYLTPPIDDCSENSIYINEKDHPAGLELYTTLAHEGYPGHLYQTVYYHLYQQKAHVDPARNLLHYGGYTEGWALYVEMLSYEYGKEWIREQSPDCSEDVLLLADAMRINRSIQLCLYSLLDLEIHYKGADYDKVHALLSKFGISQPEITRNIYEYIVEEPANYPKYYVGYLEFELLKEAAKAKWGEAYSDLRFHQMVLETGPCPFAVLWKRLE